MRFCVERLEALAPLARLCASNVGVPVAALAADFEERRVEVGAGAEASGVQLGAGCGAANVLVGADGLGDVQLALPGLTYVSPEAQEVHRQ